VPDVYMLASPVAHIPRGCPATLLIQGRDDIITPVAATEAMYQKLRENDVPAINMVYPCTDHGFDLAALRLSPPAQSALYDMERFLALLV
jgi:acetyl esterase/lipase